ncbi:LuxR C-terminal-related transcriptional regulator [Erwinia sp. AnSW2-5]|uniref:LuxR C-terminal-related transcriptional regulator n=1 Tax=Erwinia sp. AnSW2-5 TaxID=3367692 RepID=UPI00385B86E1
MKISIESENIFYKKGLGFLIQEMFPEDKIHDFLLITDGQQQEEGEMLNIIFRDSSISINLYNKKIKDDELNPNNKKSTLHIPFACKNKKTTDIKWMIGKIIFIASLKIDEYSNDDFYNITGLKKHEQLSLTETKIMLSIGRGDDINVISGQLNRSEKTIHVHWRNASRKMRMENKADFYNYAKFILTCRKNERKTLCL